MGVSTHHDFRGGGITVDSLFQNARGFAPQVSPGLLEIIFRGDVDASGQQFFRLFD